MTEEEEKVFLQYVVGVIRKFKIDQSLFPELQDRGQYFIMNEGAEKSIAMAILEKINEEADERGYDCTH